jgi:hypothetical protein
VKPAVTVPAHVVWEAAQAIKRVVPRGTADADELHALVVLLERLARPPRQAA